MKEIKGKLIEKIKRTDLVEGFRFILSDKIDFLPGQFMQVIFDEENRGNKELNKHLSFSCSPTKDYIEFTKKLSESKFSDKLRGLNVGDEVSFKLPMGKCVFEEKYKKIGFLIGGIGITPVISIIEYIVSKNLDTDVVLLYSNRTENDIAFKKELDDWQISNPNIKVVHVISDCKPSDDRCVHGTINKELMTKEIGDFHERMLFVFGPPGMVNTMKSLCVETGCNEKHVMIETFIGY